MFSSAGEIAIGVLVESAIALGIGGLLYRAFAGRFLIPKRETVLPYHRPSSLRRVVRQRWLGPEDAGFVRVRSSSLAMRGPERYE